MNQPRVLTAGGASSQTQQQWRKQKIVKDASTSHTAPTVDDSDSPSPDRAAGAPPSPSRGIENRPDNGFFSADDLRSQSVEDDDDDISYDEEQEGQSLLKDSPGKNQDLDVGSASASKETQPDDLYKKEETDSGLGGKANILWLAICFFGIMFSFVGYGLLLEYATSGGRKLHELSFLFVTSLLYTTTAAAGRYVRDETPSTIPPARFAVLGMTSMGSTFCSVRSLRYVIFPIQVLAKSCKPVPVMIMGAIMGKKYPLKKYINVCLIVAGVGLFMGGGDNNKKHATVSDDMSSSSQLMGIILLFISLCFDGGTGAYEDKLMAVHHVGPFDLMYNIQLGKTIIAGVSLLVLNQVHIFLQMCKEMGLVLVALGFTGALGQVFIFVTISKFGALTCSIIGLARKVTTLVASIYIYGHYLNGVQTTGLVISVGAMVMNFLGKKKGGGGHGHGPPPTKEVLPTKVPYKDDVSSNDVEKIELAPVKTITAGGR